MSDLDAKEFLAEYEKNKFPQEFLAKYEPLECLSQNELSETLLVKDVHTGTHYVCKCYSKDKRPVNEADQEMLKALSCDGVPALVDSFEFDDTVCIIRQYVEGDSLQRMLQWGNLSEEPIISIAVQLCDILSCLHGHMPPIIHRDIKPSNVIVQDGKAALIDFGISRTFDAQAEADTTQLGTREYAPPEQYGFSQTDNRTDIYSLGVLLRYALTLSTKPSVIANKRLDKIVKKCTSLAPEGRYASMQALKRDLLRALPQAVKRRRLRLAVILIIVIAAAAIGVHQYIEYKNRNIWPVTTPAYISSQEQIDQSVQLMNDAYHTDMFSVSDDIAGMGYLRDLLTGVFEFDEAYTHTLPPDGSIPGENEDYFLPWGFGEDDTIPRDILVYVVVKTYWPEVVTDWSSLKEDTGEYPGVRVANAFAEENNLLDGMNKYDHITFGEVAIVYANAEKLYQSMK